MKIILKCKKREKTKTNSEQRNKKWERNERLLNFWHRAKYQVDIEFKIPSFNKFLFVQQSVEKQQLQNKFPNQKSSG